MNLKTLTGVALGTCAGICWGSMAVAAQYLFEHNNFVAQDLVPLRMIGAGLILLVIHLIKTGSSLFSPFKDLRNLKDTVVYGFSILMVQLGYFLAIDYSNAGTASVLIGFMPLFIAVWLAFRLKKPITEREWFCIGLAFFGVVMLVTKGNFTTLDLSVAGVFWGLISVVFDVVCALQPAAVIKRTGIFFLMGWGMIFGGLADCVLVNPFATNGVWNLTAVLCYIEIVVFGTIFSFFCFLKSLDYVSPKVSGLLTAFEPLTAVVLMVLLFGTPFSVWEWLGAAAVIANMVILTLEPEKKEEKAA